MKGNFAEGKLHRQNPKQMKIKNKKTLSIGIGIAIVLAATGTVLGLNGFFGAPKEK